MSVPIIMMHGFGSSFVEGWQKHGWQDMFELEDREVIGVDFLGHGTSPKPHDVEAYEDVEKLVWAGIADHPVVDAVGHSAGGFMLLRMAANHPERFRRIAVLGVGNSIIRPWAPSTPVNPEELTLPAQLAGNPTLDHLALKAFMAGTRRRPPMTTDDLARITCPAVIVVGSDDAFTGAQDVVDAMPDARLVVVPGVDHSGTPIDPRVMNTVLEFLLQQ